MAGVTIRVDGFAELLHALDRMSTPRMLELAEFVGEELMLITAEAFDNERSPVTDVPWKKSRRVQKHGGKTLTHQNRLRRSVDYIAYPDGSVLQGTPSVYGRIHQKGGRAGRGRRVRIPRRRYMGWAPDYPRRLLQDPAVQELLGVRA